MTDAKPVHHVRSFDLLTSADREDYEDLVNGETLGDIRIKSQCDFPIGGESSAVMRIVDFTTKRPEPVPFDYAPPIC